MNIERNQERGRWPHLALGRSCNQHANENFERKGELDNIGDLIDQIPDAMETHFIAQKKNTNQGLRPEPGMPPFLAGHSQRLGRLVLPQRRRRH